MRSAASVPALAIVAGCALGVLEPGVAFSAEVAALAVVTAVAALAWRAARGGLLVVAVTLGCGLGGVILGEAAWREAWRPTLVVAFEARARAQRALVVERRRLVAEDDQAFAWVSGVLRGDAVPTASGAFLSLAVDAIDAEVVTGGLAITVAGSLLRSRIGEWRAGRRLKMPAQLRRPSRYLDPGVPDHERDLARRGTRLVGTVKSAALVEVVARGGPVDEAASAVRAFGRRAIADAVGRWSQRSAGIVAAIVLGDRAGLDADLQRSLQEAGTYHVIAISGGNIAILAGVLLGAFRLAGLLGPSAMLAAILLLLGYGHLVGGGPSVDRATLMAVVYLAGRAVDHRGAPTNSLAVAAGGLAAAQPLAVVDPAFVLTFGATLAILLVFPVVARRRLPRIVVPFAGLLASSVAAEVVLFPVGALVFSRVTFAGPALNFLAIPLMGVAQMAGMALLPIALVSPRAAAWSGYLAHLGASGLVDSAGLVRLAPAVVQRVAPPHWASIATYYAALASAWILWQRHVRTTGSLEPRLARAIRLASVSVAMGAALWMLAEPWTLLVSGGDGRLHVTFIDVGQGDSTFVRLPHGGTLLVDAGGLAASSFDVGDRVVAPVLRTAGVRRLDVFAATHGDPDHIGGARSILREFRPRELWEGVPVPGFEPLLALRGEASRDGVTWVNRLTGDRLVLDGVEITVRHPPRADWERRRVRNDDSLVLELRWRDVSVLLTGDIGKAVERRLALEIAPAPLRIVTVAHHGSLTSSDAEFVRALAPRMAVVSAGRANRFGHPAPEVLERYRAEGAEVFRTDRDGAVAVETDGHSLKVRTFTGRELALK